MGATCAYILERDTSTENSTTRISWRNILSRVGSLCVAPGLVTKKKRFTCRISWNRMVKLSGKHSSQRLEVRSTSADQLHHCQTSRRQLSRSSSNMALIVRTWTRWRLPDVLLQKSTEQSSFIYFYFYL